MDTVAPVKAGAMQTGHRKVWSGSMGALASLLVLAVFASLPASASAAPCPVNPGDSTAWLGGSGSLHTDANWSNGTPSGSCDVSITAAGNYTVTMTGGASMKSLTLGGPGSTPTLVISSESPNTNLNATSTGIDIATGSSIVLTCPPSPGSCLGGPAGGAGLNAGGTTIENAGAIRVDANSGTGASITGGIVNTGTMDFEQNAVHGNGTLLNQGAVEIADGKVLRSATSHCGDSTGTVFKNDTGGTLVAAGTGTLDVINYEQGNGSATGTNPVQMPCGSVKFTGNGAGKVRAYGGFSLTGTIQANQSLTVSAESNNTNAVLGGDLVNHGSITLTCPVSPGDCNGGPAGGAGFNVNGKAFTNAGTFTVAAASGTGAVLDGNNGTIVSTGTMNFDQTARLGGIVVNKGPLNIADTETVTNNGSSCGDTGASVKNDTGGSINATGSGTLVVLQYEQGNGTTSGSSPVNVPCGSVKYTGNGASKVQANGGFTLTGESHAGQSLIVNAASSNTNAVLGGDFVNKGSITLTCPVGCSGGSGGAGFNVNGKAFTNAGTFTVAATSGTGAVIDNGTTTNTGTMQFDQTARLAGMVVNKGALNIADGKTVTNNGASCGDTGAGVKNDTGGSINAAGSGALVVLQYEQGAGTTSGAAPVNVPCGAVKYTGGGASVVRATGGISITGNVAAGQTLRIVNGTSVASSFANAGTIHFDPGGSSPALNVATLTNTGRLTGVGAVNGSVDNTTGTVAPGASPGTLTVNGNYTQGAGGTLEVEVEGTEAGELDKLAVSGNATLGGTLALQPSAAFAAAAAAGDSVAFLTYGGTRTNPFATTTVTPAMPCPKQLSPSYNDGAKNVAAAVSTSGSCGGGSGGGGGGGSVDPPPPPSPPDTVLGAHPRGKVKTRKAKASVRFRFSSPLAGATFECKLDRKPFTPCASPKSYKAAPGKHTFTVRAVGPGGLVDPTPASFSFKVVRTR